MAWIRLGRPQDGLAQEIAWNQERSEYGIVLESGVAERVDGRKSALSRFACRNLSRPPVRASRHADGVDEQHQSEVVRLGATGVHVVLHTKSNVICISVGDQPSLGTGVHHRNPLDQLLEQVFECQRLLEHFAKKPQFADRGPGTDFDADVLAASPSGCAFDESADLGQGNQGFRRFQSFAIDPNRAQVPQGRASSCLEETGEWTECCGAGEMDSHRDSARLAAWHEITSRKPWRNRKCAA